MIASPVAARDLRRLQQSRNRWKKRTADKQRQIRALRVAVRDLSLSRDLWKQRCRQARRQDEAAHGVSPSPTILALPAPSPEVPPLTPTQPPRTMLPIPTTEMLQGG